MLLNQEHGGRLTIRVYVPYSLICKLNPIRKQKRSTRNTTELINHTKSQQFYFTFNRPPHYFPSRVFPGQGAGGLGEGTQSHPGGGFLLSASGNEADDPMSLKNKTKTNPSNLSKKLIQSINSSFNVHVTQNKTVP